jgi:hypothetical protein
MRSSPRLFEVLSVERQHHLGMLGIPHFCEVGEARDEALREPVCRKCEPAHMKARALPRFTHLSSIRLLFMASTKSGYDHS